MNEDLKRPLVLQSFLGVMKRKSYFDLKSLFLSLKPYKTKNCFDFDFNEFYGISRFGARNLLTANIFRIYNPCLVRGIFFVILNGHSEILQFVLKNIIKNKGNTYDLFHPKVHKDEDSRVTKVFKAGCEYVTESLFLGKKSNIHNVVDTESDTESMFEQLRLILLGCYSGDRLTIQTLLGYVEKNILDTSDEFREKQTDD